MAGEVANREEQIAKFLRTWRPILKQIHGTKVGDISVTLEHAAGPEAGHTHYQGGGPVRALPAGGIYPWISAALTPTLRNSAFAQEGRVTMCALNCGAEHRDTGITERRCAPSHPT
jgi:hypothetical protein